MKRFKAEVIEGNKAKELNPLGGMPDHLKYKHEKYKGEMTFISESHQNRYADDWDAWQKAESQRREFNIQGETEMRWVKCSERFPEKYMEHVIFRKDGIAYDCRFWFDGDGKRNHITPKGFGHLEDMGFTHWLDETAAKKYSEEDMITAICLARDGACDYGDKFRPMFTIDMIMNSFKKSLFPAIGSIVEVEEMGNNTVKIIRP